MVRNKVYSKLEVIIIIINTVKVYNKYYLLEITILHCCVVSSLYTIQINNKYTVKACSN